jgi:hemerythrin superfamily protein
VAEMLVETPDEVVKFLKAQHDLIRDMFEEVLHASALEAREKAFHDLRQLLAVHETAEEMFIHPRVRREFGNGGDSAKGDEIVDARLQEEHDAKELLAGIEQLDMNSKEFIDELTKLQQAVIDHAEHEESEEFTKLTRELDAGERKLLTKAVQLAEAIAPTRPHPGVESAKRNFALGPFAALLDRARDAISGVG